MELKPKLAQSIVDHMMTQIPYNINIMNKKGYIIASGNKSRINTLHVGAVDAIKQRKTLPMDQQYGNHGQPGVNMPLKFKNEIIGVKDVTTNQDEAPVTPEVISQIEQMFFPDKAQIAEQFKNIMNRMNDL